MAATMGDPEVGKAQHGVVSPDGGYVGGKVMDDYWVGEDPEVNSKSAITADRHGNAWYSCFHNVTAMVGAGVLGLPYAMSYLTWPGGIVALVLSSLISYWTFWQLVHLHEQGNPPNIKRMDRYHELCAYAFGSKTRGKWAILPFQLGIFIGLPITYSVTAGQSLQRMWNLLHTPGTGPSLSEWIVIFNCAQLFLSQVPSFNKLALVSMMGAVMSISYSMIAFGSSVANPNPNPAYNLSGYSTPKGVFGAFNAVATFAFAYGGHNIAMEVQATMPCPPSTVKRMMVGVNAAYIVTPICYFFVAIAGYYAYGNAVTSNVLLSIGHPKWLLVTANIFVVFHVLASYQVYAFPVFDMTEQVQLRHGIPADRWPIRLITRTCYVIFFAFVACLLPFFGDLMGLIGAIAITPTTYAMPNILWLVLKKPTRSNWQYWACHANLVLCFFVLVLGSIGAVYGIIVDASAYGVFQ